MKQETKEYSNEISNIKEIIQNEGENQINLDQEKEYLNGEHHIDNSFSDSTKIKKMNQLIVKPRETYLKEKISKINYNKNLLNNIHKDIKNQVEDIKTQITENKLSINKNEKDLTKLMENAKHSKEKNLVKYSDKEYNMRKKHKILKSLYEEQNILKAKLSKIDTNEKLLKSEGFLKLNNSYDNSAITPYDKSKKEQDMKNIKDKKNELNERLIEIEYRIKEIMQEEKDNKFSKKEKLENYKQNFERDKELIEARAEKYLKEAKERNKRISQDMEQLVLKRKMEIEKKEKEDEQKKKEILDKFKEKEKNIERKRLNDKKKIMEKYMPYRQLKLETKLDEYTYAKLDKKYIETENKLMKQINNEKKIKTKMVTDDELKNFWEQIDIKKEELKKKKEIKEQQEKEKFDMVKNFKAKYQSKYNQETDEEMHNEVDEKNNKKEILKARNESKNLYIKQYVHQPSINEVKKKERLEKIVKLEQPKLFQIKYTLKKQERNKPPDKKKLEWFYKLKKESAYKNLNNSADMDNPLSLIKKPKMMRLSSSFNKSKKKENVSPKQFNYLEELRNKKEKRQNSSENINIKINDEKNNSLEDIQAMKERTQLLEKKAQMGEELLRANGGIGNNPKLGKQVSDMYISSIENKIKLLNKVYDN